MLIAPGYELDDDPVRINREAVHRVPVGRVVLGGRARPRGDGRADRDGGTCRRPLRGGRPASSDLPASSPTVTRVSYLADVYVLDEARGRGFGLELVRFAVDEEPLRQTKWLLHTRDMHPLYAKLGFEAPGERTMERWPRPG